MVLLLFLRGDIGVRDVELGVRVFFVFFKRCRLCLGGVLFFRELNIF